jgi:hypothetical protein
MINQRRSMLIAKDSVYNRLKRAFDFLDDDKASKVGKAAAIRSAVELAPRIALQAPPPDRRSFPSSRASVKPAQPQRPSPFGGARADDPGRVVGKNQPAASPPQRMMEKV